MRQARGWAAGRWVAVGLLVTACGDEPVNTPFDSGTGQADPTQGASELTGGTSEGSSDDAGSGTVPVLDVAPDGPGPGGGHSCTLVDDMDGIAPCVDHAPADSFDPVVEWVWSGEDGMDESVVIPLVANLNDDNGDGKVDLCDTPDVVVTVYETLGSVPSPLGAQTPGRIYAVDGKTGETQFAFEGIVDATATPALGDIDGDGAIEVVAKRLDPPTIVIFNADGSVQAESVHQVNANHPAIALADLEGDGQGEILVANTVLESDASFRFSSSHMAGSTGGGSATIAADLDGDGDLEVVIGQAAYHHDGTLYYETQLEPGYPQVADLDDDPEPEIILTNPYGMSGDSIKISILEHDGQVKLQIPASSWTSPVAVHDFDGNGLSEVAFAVPGLFGVYDSQLDSVWSSPVNDASGVAAATAFDFLGDGSAEAMFADEHKLLGFNAEGATIFDAPRSSRTMLEYPVVADVDDDGSAEILVVSNERLEQTAPALQLIGDAQARWVPSRRIWNQHSYHVTNVREDGTLPLQEEPSWALLNTYRTNAQISESGVCQPPAG